MDRGDQWQFKARFGLDLRDRVRALARRRRLSVGKLVESLLERELDEQTSGALPDESAIREMAILVAVEHCLKLQEASIPGGFTLSGKLVESAAQAAMARLDMVEASVQAVRD
jgi:hypothetical protein